MSFIRKREKYLTWEEAFMGQAVLISQRSKDPNTQVGACLVSEDNYILSLGYNGLPLGMNDDDFNWTRDLEDPNNKYKYVCHAESNAIDNFKGEKKNLYNSTIYVTLFPCPDCAKRIVQNKIGKVVYLSDKYENTPDNLVAKRILDSANVDYVQFEKKYQKKYTLKLTPDYGLKENNQDE